MLPASDVLFWMTQCFCETNNGYTDRTECIGTGKRETHRGFRTEYVNISYCGEGGGVPYISNPH